MLPSSPHDRAISISNTMESVVVHLCTVLHIGLLLSIHFNINDFVPLGLIEVIEAIVAVHSFASSCAGFMPAPDIFSK